MAAHPRPFHSMPSAGKLIAPDGGAGNLTTDTTYTKIFVGGLAWETQRDAMHRYFEQFGEILEAVVITDKNTGRSKGYGFVTFKESTSATRACENPSPVIDGRRANCNLAFLGASNRTRPPTPQFGIARFRPPASSSTMIASAYRGAAPLSATYYHQPAHYALPYSVYGYSAGYSQETLYPMNYYGVGGQQQQFSPYYSQANPGVFPNYHPYYAQYSQSTHAHGGLSMHYPQMIQYPYLPQQFGSGSAAILSLPTSINAASTAGLNAGSSMESSSSKPPRITTTSDQNKASTS